MKYNCKFLACVLALVLLCSFYPVTAFSAPIKSISLGQTKTGKLEDRWGDVTYRLKISGTRKVKLKYTSKVKTNVAVYDAKLNKVMYTKAKKNVTKTISLKKGEYKIALYNTTYQKKKYTLKLKDVTSYTTAITLSHKKLDLTLGQSFKLTYTKTPKNSVVKSIKWSSSNSKVASVKSGVVTAKEKGKATIKAKLHNGFVAVCTVVVKEKPKVHEKPKRESAHSEHFSSPNIHTQPNIEIEIEKDALD